MSTTETGAGTGTGHKRPDCERPDCTGAVEDFGDGELYCDVCGFPPDVSPDGVIASRATGLATAALLSGGRPGSPPASARTHRTAGPSGPTGSPAGSTESSAGSTGSSAALSTASGVSVRGSRRDTGSAASRKRLGAGLVSVPEVPGPDPASAVLEDPRVPERKRFCGNPECGGPVGRSRDGRPGRTEGFCTRCGRPYSFVPRLRRGEIVGGQYEIVGCLAHGGLGWIYLAIDHPLDRRWVVLKGLLDTGDEDAMAAAIAERRFLSQIEHASIVRVYNFVEHLDPRTGTRDGYIVMEYVGGKSLKDIANDRRTPGGGRDPLPVAQACAYGIEALEALGYLHSRNLLYCDFKVDNAIQQHHQLKLIDMGAVRRMDDPDGAVYGTVGYQAPEVGDVGPSVASDLYTVARTLAVLTFDFRGYTNVFVDSLPAPEHVEVFQRYESFYRLLVRATDPDPRRRFASAEEMAEQLTGVLREVVALDTGEPQPAVSTLFGPETTVVDTGLLARLDGDASALGSRRQPARRRLLRRRGAGTPGSGTRPEVERPSGGAALAAPRFRETALALPLPRVDESDPNAAFVTGLGGAPPEDVLTALDAAPADSVELRLRRLRAQLDLGAGRSSDAAATLADLLARHPDDWRVLWHRGLTALTEGDRETAAHAFDAVYDAFPGETAPKLALAVCAEALGQLDHAAEYFRLVWTTDPNHVSAAFGLARVLLAAGRRAEAVAALESVPAVSIHHVSAQVAAVRARLRGRAPDEPMSADLYAAADRVTRLRRLGLDARRRERLVTEVLGAALDWVLAGRHGEPAGRHGEPAPLLGCPLDETGLRLGLERACRMLARLATGRDERIEWVERANRLRPRTWV
ncbi:tetratricopeptide repeat protein [Streptomyces durbertensis]|uniref:non-specific serine/threonine protein kinase n=1 Tax=Streptomyces durbertensis TaxID=2448886 RepID=A0ABR6ELZ1_9ACTN|nr:serine/threonine-protein kinase [Streptomyces durbertensis]MBB1246352.1 tetratricopeptide repeat protein [Streptomyces durbertensis]